MKIGGNLDEWESQKVLKRAETRFTFEPPNDKVWWLKKSKTFSSTIMPAL